MAMNECIVENLFIDVVACAGIDTFMRIAHRKKTERLCLLCCIHFIFMICLQWFFLLSFHCYAHSIIRHILSTLYSISFILHLGIFASFVSLLYLFNCLLSVCSMYSVLFHCHFSPFFDIMCWHVWVENIWRIFILWEMRMLQIRYLMTLNICLYDNEFLRAKWNRLFLVVSSRYHHIYFACINSCIRPALEWLILLLRLAGSYLLYHVPKFSSLIQLDRRWSVWNEMNRKHTLIAMPLAPIIAHAHASYHLAQICFVCFSAILLFFSLYYSWRWSHTHDSWTDKFSFLFTLLFLLRFFVGRVVYCWSIDHLNLSVQ